MDQRRKKKRLSIKKARTVPKGSEESSPGPVKKSGKIKKKTPGKGEGKKAFFQENGETLCEKKCPPVQEINFQKRIRKRGKNQGNTPGGEVCPQKNGRKRGKQMPPVGAAREEKTKGEKNKRNDKKKKTQKKKKDSLWKQVGRRLKKKGGEEVCASRVVAARYLSVRGCCGKKNRKEGGRAKR